MDDQNEILTVAGLSESDTERLSEAIRALAEKCGISADEAAYRVSQAIISIRDIITAAFDTLTAAFRAIEEDLAAISIEPRPRWRKRNRTRAQAIERRYMVQIRHYERATPYRRIYKPP